MKARIVITADGQVRAFIDEGSYDEAKDKLEKLVKQLTEQGISFDQVDPVEQHRHDDGTVHAHNHAHSGHSH